ncbi:MAG TPA: hypothetical protein DCW29_22345 [Janthinobacterium sp.]|nr:hypothetical protein [Janthinobacterium sp.]
MNSKQAEPLALDTQAAVDTRARNLGLQAGDPWVGGYVDYRWKHSRPILEAMGLRHEGMRVLEFGCNVGASAILFARLGAVVSAVDVSADWIGLARLNADLHGVGDIDFVHVDDTRAPPFADAQFDLLTCNGVLEYVDDDQRAAVQREIDRVLKPGGMILLTGSSNRLWPRETHSGLWPVNYLPRALDRLWRKPLQRGLWPWVARHGYGRHYDNLDTARAGDFFARSRKAMGAPPCLLAALLWVAARLRVGWAY